MVFLPEENILSHYGAVIEEVWDKRVIECNAYFEKFFGGCNLLPYMKMFLDCFLSGISSRQLYEC